MAGAAPDRNLALDLVRVTEAAAMGAGRWIGRGEKESADQAAVDAMRHMLQTVAMAGVVVIGEGEKDEAPMLYNGEHVGNGQGVEVDVAVDPLEGTRLTALGMPNAIAVIAVAERGTMFFPGAAVYMDKIAVGRDGADAIDIDAPPAENVRRVAKAKGKKVEDMVVVVLDRERHADLIREVREAGASVRLITDGDVAPSIAASRVQSNVDLLMGIGGTPEGVISAAAIKCLGGAIQGKLWPRSDEERQALVDAGYDLDKVLTTDDLVSGDGRVRRGHRRHRRCAAVRRPLHPWRCDHGVDRDALAVRHRAPDRGLPRVRQAARTLGRTLRLKAIRIVAAWPTSFIRRHLRDGSTHTVLVPENATAEGLVGLAAKGQSWPPDGGWIEVEGGGAVTKRFVAADQIVSIELFERT